MSDPVIAADGTTYERICIERWLENHDTSPKTNQILPSKALIPNYSIRNCIHKLAKAQRLYDKLSSSDSDNEHDTITVQTATSDRLLLHVDFTSDTVHDSKKKIFESTGIKPENQRLIYNGKMMEDANMLSSYSIESGKVIHLVLRFLGGSLRFQGA
eukprot:gene28335-37268_t